MKKGVVGVDKASIKINFFDLLELPLSYNLPPENLEKNYLKLQKIYHPDNFPEPEAKNKAFSQSMLINEGYTVLKSPLERAKHLLVIAGVDIKTVPPFEFLEEVLHLKEEAETLPDITFLYQKLSNMVQNLVSQFDKLFIKKDYEILKVLICKLQYLSKICKELELR